MRFHTDANLATIRDGGRGDGLDCIPPTRYRRPRFAFSASDPETSAALRQTIESKMKTAGVLGGFLTGLFTFAAKDIGAALMTVNVSKASITFDREGVVRLRRRGWSCRPPYLAISRGAVCA